MPGTHAGPADQRVLCALPSRSCFVAQRRVRRRLARLVEQVVGRLVTQTIGMLAPSPEVGIFDRLSGQLRFENLWTSYNEGCEANQLKKDFRFSSISPATSIQYFSNAILFFHHIFVLDSPSKSLNEFYLKKKFHRDCRTEGATPCGWQSWEVPLGVKNKAATLRRLLFAACSSSTCPTWFSRQWWQLCGETQLARLSDWPRGCSVISVYSRDMLRRLTSLILETLPYFRISRAKQSLVVIVLWNRQILTKWII